MDYILLAYFVACSSFSGLLVFLLMRRYYRAKELTLHGKINSMRDSRDIWCAFAVHATREWLKLKEQPNTYQI